MRIRHVLVALGFVGLLGVGACCDKPTCDDLDRWAQEMVEWGQEVNNSIIGLNEHVEELSAACFELCDELGLQGPDCPCIMPSTPPPPRNPPPGYPN